MFEYLSGVTTRIVCDDLKTRIISHLKEGEIVLMHDDEAFWNHYVTAILSAQIRKPKQRANVERTIRNITTSINTKLHNKTFNSFPEPIIVVPLIFSE